MPALHDNINPDGHLLRLAVIVPLLCVPRHSPSAGTTTTALRHLPTENVHRAFVVLETATSVVTQGVMLTTT